MPLLEGQARIRLKASRRELLRMSSALAALSLLGCMDERSIESQESQFVPTRIVDAHCHVFNASDLSVRGFVHRVVLKDHEDEVLFPPATGPQPEGALESFASLLVDLLASGSITAEEELAEVRRGGPLVESQDQGEFLGVLAESLERMSRAPLEESEVDIGRKELFEAISKEAGFTAETFQGEVAAERLITSDGFFGRNFRWARQLTGRRQSLVEELIALYGGAEGVALLAPALVDYAAWLDDEPRSNLASQIAIMDEMQQRASVNMHCLAPYDPWRQIRDLATGSGPSALELVQSAILEHGFIGVKVYPPMGFLPLGNASHEMTFPERAWEEFGSSFPSMIDAALRSLYAWCEEQQVAVMTHATMSQGANTDYAMRASPEGWKTVLERYPQLRLNLGHFGHFDDMRAENDPRPWETAVGEIIAAGYRNVFADLSYLDEVLPSKSGRDRVIKGLQQFVALHRQAGRHLIYGSDWIMVGREPGSSDYHVQLAKMLTDAGFDEPARAAIYRTNALRYFGLVEGSPAVDRLRAYYVSRGMDTSRIEGIILSS